VLINRLTASKVPEVTVFFWIIKILSTTVGETAADTLNVDLNFALIAYVLTRPLGASLGDLLAQDRDAGGVQLGATASSVVCADYGVGELDWPALAAFCLLSASAAGLAAEYPAEVVEAGVG